MTQQAKNHSGQARRDHSKDALSQADYHNKTEVLPCIVTDHKPLNALGHAQELVIAGCDQIRLDLGRFDLKNFPHGYCVQVMSSNAVDVVVGEVITFMAATTMQATLLVANYSRTVIRARLWQLPA